MAVESSTEEDSDGAWIRIMYSDDNYIDRRDSGRVRYLFAVLRIKIVKS